MPPALFALDTLKYGLNFCPGPPGLGPPFYASCSSKDDRRSPQCQAFSIEMEVSLNFWSGKPGTTIFPISDSQVAGMMGAPTAPNYWLRWGLAKFLPRLVLKGHPPNLCLLCNQDYKGEPLAPSCWGNSNASQAKNHCPHQFLGSNDSNVYYIFFFQPLLSPSATTLPRGSQSGSNLSPGFMAHYFPSYLLNWTSRYSPKISWLFPSCLHFLCSLSLIFTSRTSATYLGNLQFLSQK
jgi:hypothetical protein